MMTASPVPAVYTVAALAERLGVCSATIGNMLKAGRLPEPLRVGAFGRAKRWDFQTIKRWIAAGAPTAEEWERREVAASSPMTEADAQ